MLFPPQTLNQLIFGCNIVLFFMVRVEMDPESTPETLETRQKYSMNEMPSK